MLCFRMNFLSAIFFLLAQVSSCNIQMDSPSNLISPKSKHRVVNMYHGPKRSDIVPNRKGNKETGNDVSLPVSRMLWNCVEDSRDFYIPVMDTTASPVPKGRE